MNIRQTKLGDYTGIYNLLKSEGMIHISLPKDKFSRMLKKNKGLYFVAVEKKRIIGNVFASYDGGMYVYVYKLAVDKNYRRKGAAKKLLAKILNKFKNNRETRIYCCIRKENNASIGLFTKLKFAERKDLYFFDNSQK